MEQSVWGYLIAPAAALLTLLIERIYSERAAQRQWRASIKESRTQHEVELVTEDVRVIMEWLDVMLRFAHRLCLSLHNPILKQRGDIRKEVLREIESLHLEESRLVPLALYRARSLSPEIAGLCDNVQMLSVRLLERYVGGSQTEDINFIEFQQHAGNVRAALRQHLLNTRAQAFDDSKRAAPRKGRQ